MLDTNNSKTYNDIKVKNSKQYGGSSSDRLYELLNQRSFGYLSEKRKGGISCEDGYKDVKRCNEDKYNKNL